MGRSGEMKSDIRRITLPTNPISLELQRNFAKKPIQIATKTSTTIRDILKKKPRNNNDRDKIGGIYTIPCNLCDKVYVGETSQTLEERLKEHTL